MPTPPLHSGESARLRLTPDSPLPLSEIRAWAVKRAGEDADVLLLLTELVTNAREHGEPGPIAIEIRRRQEQVELVVSNQSPPPPPAVPAASHMVPVTQNRGRGLQIANAIADELTIEQAVGVLRITAIISVGS